MNRVCSNDFVVFRWKDVNQWVESVQNQGPTQEWTTTHTGMYRTRIEGVCIAYTPPYIFFVAFIGKVVNN